MDVVLFIFIACLSGRMLLVGWVALVATFPVAVLGGCVRFVRCVVGCVVFGVVVLVWCGGIVGVYVVIHGLFCLLSVWGGLVFWSLGVWVLYRPARCFVV